MYPVPETLLIYSNTDKNIRHRAAISPTTWLNLGSVCTSPLHPSSGFSERQTGKLNGNMIKTTTRYFFKNVPQFKFVKIFSHDYSGFRDLGEEY